MKSVYDTLSKIENLRDKMEIDEYQTFITIDFNEYLHLAISDDMIELNYNLHHWHPDSEDDIIQDVTEIANGDIIFIESRGFFTRPRKWNIRICDNAITALEKKVFEKKKGKYLAKKHLRIYTGNEILKRSIK
ncbi:MAG: hypothetical protein FWG91_06385 [Lachnospiraceae bacterium]|nr:hypothetical protein [Lachnospiraceae bacterium]